MITEDYVSFEVAKLLNEKGFDEQCRDFYRQENGNWLHRNTYEYNYFNLQMPIWKDCYACPTHQMAMKWLREVHDLSVETFSIKGTSNVCPVFWKGNVVKLLTQDRAFNGELVGSYEEAVEAALKYSLENLI